MAFNDKTYAVLNIADIDSVNFSEVITTSKETVRKSIDKSQFLIKYTETPSFISGGQITPISVMNHEDILTLMDSADWTAEME
jgi:hypothetical protein